MAKKSYHPRPAAPSPTHGMSLVTKLAVAAAGVAALLISFNVGGVFLLGATALAGGGLYAWQHNKAEANRDNARENYSRTPGYHHERERVRDDSLMHRIQGASDLPERVNYILEHYGVSPQSKQDFRKEHHATGISLALGLGAGLLVAAAISSVAIPAFGISVATLSLLGGSLTGLTAAGFYNARVSNGYDRYVDGFEKGAHKAWEQHNAALRERTKARRMEYDNSRARPGSYADDVTASRQADQGLLRQ